MSEQTQLKEQQRLREINARRIKFLMETKIFFPEGDNSWYDSDQYDSK